MTRAEEILKQVEAKAHSEFIRGRGYTGAFKGSPPKRTGGRIVQRPDGSTALVKSRKFGNKKKKRLDQEEE